MELVLSLLLDKLEIAAGEYKFPLLAHGNDVLALVEREKEAAMQEAVGCFSRCWPGIVNKKGLTTSRKTLIFLAPRHGIEPRT